MAEDWKMSSGIEKANEPKPDAQAVAVTGKSTARRGFLLGAGVAAGAAGAAAITLGKPAPVARVQAAEPAARGPVQGQGYHVTAHVRKYYDTTKV
jgi:hypothetical protein